jgi:formylglycine-generating enzyme required for sulfatase activity
VALVACVDLVACADKEKRREPPPVTTLVPQAPATPDLSPRLLYLPDAAPAQAPLAVPKVPPPRRSTRCPPEMVLVRDTFCIDRYEVTLVDAGSGRALSPYYHPTAEATRREWERWQRLKPTSKRDEGRNMPIPAPPEWSLSAAHFDPMAVSSQGAIPNGYLSGQIAAAACTRADKRLCTPEEWVTACRGEKNRKYPYGHLYEEGRCNVFRTTHPARLLHGDASEGHLDPRLNQVVEGTDPLLRPTGSTVTCASEWNGDAVYDMVGNLDEWVDDPDGTFVGGFYSRSTREGCDARVEVHSYDYYDYSLGTRCCKGL